MEQSNRISFQRFGIGAAGRKWVYAGGIALLAVYALIALRGPQGIPALVAKYREIRQLEEQNAALALENQHRRERIQRLQTSTSEQEMEIRKQLKLLRPGETTFILPDAPKAAPNNAGAPANSPPSPAQP